MIFKIHLSSVVDESEYVALASGNPVFVVPSLMLVYVVLVLALVFVVLVLSQCNSKPVRSWWCECDPVPRIIQAVCASGNSGAHATCKPCRAVPHIRGRQCHIFTRLVALATHAEQPCAPSVAAFTTTAQPTTTVNEHNIFETK